MTEADYLKATNRVKVSAALTIMRDVLPGDDWGISDVDHGKIIKLLRKAELELFHSFALDTSGSEVVTTVATFQLEEPIIQVTEEAPTTAELYMMGEE